ncbi:hypothetical protein BOX15_Mlig033264g1, partial [Macrostomum lignano]
AMVMTDKQPQRRPSGSGSQPVGVGAAGVAESAQIHSGHFMMSNLEDADSDSNSLSDFPVDFSDTDKKRSMLAAGSGPAAVVPDAPIVVNFSSADAAASASTAAAATAAIAASTGAGTAEQSAGAAAISFDQSLTKLLCYLKLTYSGKITNPKWNDFRGMRFKVKEKIRLNNIIWREYHLQFVRQQRPRIVQFANPLADEAHSRAESVIMEGKYWKRRLDTVCNEYHSWRTFYRQNRHRLKTSRCQEPMDIVYDSDWLAQNTELDIKRRGVGATGTDWPMSPRESQPPRAPSVHLLDDLLADFQLDPNLDSLLAACDGFSFGGLLGGADTAVCGSGYVNGVGIVDCSVGGGGGSGGGIGGGVNSDFIQPGLQQLQPSIDDFIGGDQLLALLTSSAAVSVSATAAMPMPSTATSVATTFAVPTPPPPPPPPPLTPQPPPPPPPLQQTPVVNLSPAEYQRIVSTLQGLLARTNQPPAVVSALLDYLRGIGIHVQLPTPTPPPPLPPPAPAFSIAGSETLYRILRAPVLPEPSPPPPPLQHHQQQQQRKLHTQQQQPEVQLPTAIPKSDMDCSSLSGDGFRIELPSMNRHRESYLLHKQSLAMSLKTEQARRVSINSAFDTLQALLPVSGSQKLAKAALLHKAADRLRQLRSERAESRRQAELLRAEAARLRAEIGTACEHLSAASSATAASTAGSAHGQQRQQLDGRRWFEDSYAGPGVLNNWKFYLFSLMVSDAFDAYNSNVSTCSIEDFARTVLNWADQHFCLTKLRPSAHRALTQLCVTTSILTDPGQTSSQVIAGVHSGNLPIRLTAASSAAIEASAGAAAISDPEDEAEDYLMTE